MRSQLLFMPAAVVLAAAPAVGLDYQTLEAAQGKLFPNATFIPATFSMTGDQVEQLRAEYNVPVMRPEVRVWRVSTGGWLFLDQVFGLNDTVTYLAGIDDRGTVTGIEILVCVEGFCDLAAPEWRAQLVGKKFGKWVPKDEVTNISGATLTTMHVTEGVKKLLAIHALYMPKKR
jgi:hypothetical protein